MVPMASCSRCRGGARARREPSATRLAQNARAARLHGQENRRAATDLQHARIAEVTQNGHFLTSFTQSDRKRVLQAICWRETVSYAYVQPRRLTCSSNRALYGRQREHTSAWCVLTIPLYKRPHSPTNTTLTNRPTPHSHDTCSTAIRAAGSRMCTAQSRARAADRARVHYQRLSSSPADLQPSACWASC